MQCVICEQNSIGLRLRCFFAVTVDSRYVARYGRLSEGWPGYAGMWLVVLSYRSIYDAIF
ncbi:hypothetical protein HDG33_003781 [Paraburkholderia sp. Cpub6]|nr:hypothetical protein [Paraburkholderia sp. Cpub6]